MRKILIFGIFTMGILVGVGIGFMIGGIQALDWCVEKGFKLLELKGIEVDVNEDLLKYGIEQYKRKVDGWLG